jgi:hypothetical protein
MKQPGDCPATLGPHPAPMKVAHHIMRDDSDRRAGEEPIAPLREET